MSVEQYEIEMIYDATSVQLSSTAAYFKFINNGLALNVIKFLMSNAVAAI